MSRDVKQVDIDDSLLIFAEKQSKKLEKKVTILFKAFLFIVLCIGPISLFLSYFSNQTHIEKPALIDRDNNVEYVEPLVNPSINYTYAGDIAEDYAEDLLSFHFLKIDKQLQSRNSYFFHGFFEPLYMEPLIESSSINKIINQKNLNNKEFFFRKYKEFLNHSRDNSNYLWHEIVLNNFYNKKDF